MKRLLNLLPTIFFLISLLPPAGERTTQQAQTPPAAEPASGSVLCAPGVYTTPPDGCLPLGPSEFLTQMAAAGLPYPVESLPSFPPSYDLNSIPYSYFKVSDSGTAVFGSLDDAMANQSPIRSLYPGELFVSYVARVDNDQGVFYQLRSGLWIRGEGGRLAVPVFQGLQFSSTPRNSFGWVLGTIVVRSAPGLNSPETGRVLYRYNVVQVYGSATANDEGWDMIGPDEWVEGREIGEVDPHTSPPKGVTTDRWIEVNLQEQTLSVYDHDKLVFATLTSTGIASFWTRPGLFQIREKKAAETMTKAYTPGDPDYYYLEDVPWTMYFDEDRALHGAYWHNGFGYVRSHGCVNLSVGDSHWLFNWANVGDYVYVYDPSGNTPTDPSLYGTGAP